MSSSNDVNTSESANSNGMKFPHFASGIVVKGFNRGSKELGIPTANYPDSVTDDLPVAFHNGVYYGYAQVDNGPVYKMVMSVGNNPYYNNEKRTMVSFIFVHSEILF
jgi:riboflavin kinase